MKDGETEGGARRVQLLARRRQITCLVLSDERNQNPQVVLWILLEWNDEVNGTKKYGIRVYCACVKGLSEAWIS